MKTKVTLTPEEVGHALRAYVATSNASARPTGRVVIHVVDKILASADVEVDMSPTSSGVRDKATPGQV
jgi:hypothetical protein